MPWLPIFGWNQHDQSGLQEDFLMRPLHDQEVLLNDFASHQVPSFAVFYEFSASSLLNDLDPLTDCLQEYDPLAHVILISYE